MTTPTTKTRTLANATLLLLLLSLPVNADQTKMPTLLNLVAGIESSHNPQAVGDSGLARGEFQFHKAAWEQVSAQRKAQGKKAYPYAYAHDRFVARQYAEAYLTWLGDDLHRRLGRKPLAWEVYAAFNRGVGGFATLGFRFDRLPKHTQRSCRSIAAALNEPLTR
jgi:hypothetical protein